MNKIGETEHDVRNQLAQEEARNEQAGIVPLHDVSPSGFISSILELEEQQYVQFYILTTTLSNLV